MEDRDIVNLYLDRNFAAINETAAKYGNYCGSIARSILGNEEDAEECVNDTYLNAWNSIPPHRPDSLSTYLGKITRNLSFDRFRKQTADKRGGGETALVLEELSECVSGKDSVEQAFDRQELAQVINDFLDTLPKKKYRIFLCRYWYAYSIPEIAEKFKITEGNVSVTLNRIRAKLKKFLEERSYEI